jgi:hypothetical protein
MSGILVKPWHNRVGGAIPAGQLDFEIHDSTQPTPQVSADRIYRRASAFISGSPVWLFSPRFHVCVLKKSRPAAQPL